MTGPDAHELLSALLDREPVDPDRLAALLERPEARALLVDFVRVRAAFHGDVDPAPAPAPAPAATAPRRWRVPAVVLRLAAAAILVAAGVEAGQRLAATDAETPPEPSRVVQLVPASDGGRR